MTEQYYEVEPCKSKSTKRECSTREVSQFDGSAMVLNLKDLSGEEVIEAVTIFLGNDHFVLNDFIVRPASETPLGFLGDHLRIKVNVSINGKDKDLHFFVKRLPGQVASHYEYAIGTKAFYKEIELYKTFFQDVKNSISKTRKTKKWMPEFLFSRGSELFIVEDLSIDGYYMFPERTLLDMDHMKVALEAMAIMHAGSFIFEEKLNAGEVTTLSENYTPGKKVTIGDLYEHLTFETEASDIKGHPGNTFWEAGFRSQLAVIDLLPDYTESQREVIRKQLTNKLRQALQFVKPSDKFKNVMLHGDLWSNNLLFRKDDTGAVTEAVIVDFQLARYGPPAHDILMFLYLVQNRAFRKKHEKELIDFYYEKLTEELAAESLDVNNHLPRDEFDKSIEFYREYAILNNVMYFQLILAPGEITGEFMSSPELYEENMKNDRSAMIVACFQKDDICRDRVTEAMREVAEFYNWV